MIKLKKLFFIPTLAAVGFLIGLVILISSGLNDQIGKADVALVLGNTVDLDGKPSTRLRARLDKALELYRAGYFPTIIVSGGIGKEGYEEAQVMRDYLVSHGISAEYIIMDNTGINTFVSANNTVQIIRQSNKKSIFVVSQYFHLPRARLALERMGVVPIYSAHANFFEMRDVYSSLREVVSYVYYTFRDYGSGE